MISNDTWHPNNQIVLSGEVDEAMFVSCIKQLGTIKPNAPIYVDLNTDGGDWYYGIGIYDRLSMCKQEVIIRVWGCAMSMGSVILQAGDKRLVAPNAMIMVHSISETLGGNVHEIGLQHQITKQLCDKMFRIFAEKSHKSNQFWALKCKKDFYITAQEAIKLGLADEIIEEI